MKRSKADVSSKAHKIPELEFESHVQTSYAGLVVFQALFAELRLKERISACFRHLQSAKSYSWSVLFLQLVLHILLGFRDLRDSIYYRDDPMVQRLLGLRFLPNSSTITRRLATMGQESIDHLRDLVRQLNLEELMVRQLHRVTIEFDGVIQSTSRHAEGTAVGFNPKKKGARSYYPLFATIAQIGQVFDFLHRSGNVHDSRDAKPFILECIDRVRTVLSNAVIEVRLDAAFFSDEIVTALWERGVEFTISVPFERLPDLKSRIEQRTVWYRIDRDRCYFELPWKPASWRRRHRFIVVATRKPLQRKEPLQLTLWEPDDHEYEYKVIVTNKTIGAAYVAEYHDGRGTQEGIFAELQSQCAMGHVPVQTRNGNQAYLLAGILAHNLTRILQMRSRKPERGTTPRRAPLWIFEQAQTIRKKWIQRAGRFTRPKGRLTLVVSAGRPVAREILGYLRALLGPAFA